MEEVKIRLAKETEIDWVNSKYTEVDFVPSHFEDEIIAVSEIGDNQCGIGRIVIIDADNCELGGMYVFKEFRGLKIAEKIVEFLVKSVDHTHKNIWCLPFEKLFNFYNKFGFNSLETAIEVPESISKKHMWCNSNYDEKVLLLLKTTNNS